MFKILLLVSVFSVSSVVCAKHSLPPYLEKCSMSDPNLSQCYVDHGNKAIPIVSKGDKKYHIPNLEPFKVDKISIDTTSNLHLDLSNVEIHGLNKTKLLTADLDLTKDKYTFTYSIPNIELNGDYEMKGSILVLSLEGKGTCTFNFKNVKFVYNVVYERYTKDDVPHLRRVSSSLDYDMEHASMRFNNLFNGNKQLGDEVNKVLNENWKEVSGEFKPAVSSTILQIVDTIFARFLDIVSADDIFDP